MANGSDLAVVVSLPGRSTAIAASSDGGQTWTTTLVPQPHVDWSTFLLDPMRWRLTDNRVILSTDDAGKHWHTDPLPTFLRAPLHPHDLKFLPPHLAWAIPYNPHGGPIWWTAGSNDWQPITITVTPSPAP